MKDKKLSDLVLAARVRRFWTQADLADAAGVSAKLIANIENGRTLTCTPRVLAKLGAALGKNLMRYTPSRKP